MNEALVAYFMLVMSSCLGRLSEITRNLSARTCTGRILMFTNGTQRGSFIDETNLMIFYLLHIMSLVCVGGLSEMRWLVEDSNASWQHCGRWSYGSWIVKSRFLLIGSLLLNIIIVRNIRWQNIYETCPNEGLIDYIKFNMTDFLHVVFLLTIYYRPWQKTPLISLYESWKSIFHFSLQKW